MRHNLIFSKLAFLGLLCTAVSSCTSTKTLSSDPSVTEEIENRSLLTPAYIEFIDGDAAIGFRVAVRADSTEWYGADTLYSASSGLVDSVAEVRHISSTSDITSITVSTPDVLEGMLVGAGAGAISGTVIWGGDKVANPSGTSQAQLKGWAIGLGLLGAIEGFFRGGNSVTEYYNDSTRYDKGEKWWH